MNAKIFKSVLLRNVHGIAKHSREYNTELVHTKLFVAVSN